MAEATKRTRSRAAAPPTEVPAAEHQDHLCTVGFCPICRCGPRPSSTW
jgi:hypothetical protein